MPAVSHLTRAKRVEAVIELGDDDRVTVGFDRNKITPAWRAAVEERDERDDPFSVPHALADVILDWDITQDDGSPFPPTAENIGVLSYPVQAELMMQILRAAIPSRAEKNESSTPFASTSAPTASSEVASPISPNGSETSPSPSASAAQSLT